MLFSKRIYIGVDPTSGRKAFTYAAIDQDMELVAMAGCDLDDLLAFIGGQQAVVVAVNAPSHTNLGLVRQILENQSLTPGQHQIRGADMRLAEYELRAHGINISGTPSRTESCSAWVQSGFDVYRHLSRMGFKSFPADGATHLWLETHPHAGFSVLLEQIPFPKPTLEGRLQRQLALHDRGLRIKDPMEFFEEITRYRLLKGILPTEMIYLPEFLDALMAAYTAFQAACTPDDVVVVGDETEGRMVLPVRQLKARYDS
jgi:hypothetical protein